MRISLFLNCIFIDKNNRQNSISRIDPDFGSYDLHRK